MKLRLGPLVLSATLLCAACASDVTGVASLSKVVGPAGDNVQVAGASVSIPAAALTNATTLTFVAGTTPPVVVPPTFTQSTSVFAFTPHGLTFASPVTVRLPIQQNPEGAAKVLRLRDASATRWTEVPGVVRDGNYLVFPTTSFSFYVGGSGGTGCTPQCSGKVCGDDGCGGACGSCATTELCTALGQCAAVLRASCGDLRGTQANAPWPMARGCAARTGRSAAAGPARPGIGWSFTTSPASALTAPAIGADGTLYVGAANGKVYALSPTTGQPRWSYVANGAVRTTPALASNGQIIAADDAGTVHGIAADGQRAFSLSLTSGALEGAPALGSDGTIYVTSASGTLYAVDSAGRKKWEFPLGAASRFSPAVGADGTLYAGTAAGALQAVSRAGQSVWTYQATNASDLASGPAVTQAFVYFAAQTTATASLVLAISPDRSTSWQTTPGAVVGTAPALAHDDSRLYFSERGTAAFNGLLALDTATRAATWQSTTPQNSGAPPLVDSAGVVYYGAADGTLRAVNPDGRERWSVVVAQNLSLGEVVLGAGGAMYVVNLTENKLHSLQEAP